MSRRSLQPKPKTKKMVSIDNTSEAFCFFCNKHLSRDNFYPNDDTRILSKLSPICKNCAKEIAERYEYGAPTGLTENSLKTALRFMNKPFIRAKYDAAIQAHKTNEKVSVFGNYMRLLALDGVTRAMTWEDGDDVLMTVDEAGEDKRRILEPAIQRQMLMDQKDVIRLMGYDPYAEESEDDKPLLYNKTVGFLNGSPEANEDALKLSSIVEIVKLFSQAEKINDVIASLSKTKQDMVTNVAAIKTLEGTKKDIMINALSLAKDNGISAAHNTNRSKGSSTFSGMSKLMNEMNLREHQVNSFDVETAAGMEAVANLSVKAILKQIQFDENDFPEMIAEQRKLIDRWRKTAAKAVEQTRILLQENVDLKNRLLEYDTQEILANSIEFDSEGGINDTVLITDQMLEEANAISEDIFDEKDLDFTDEGGDDNE